MTIPGFCRARRLVHGLAFWPALCLRRSLVGPLVVVIASISLYLLTRGPSISWADGATDSGELAAAAYTLGVPHPTGYPLYMLAGWMVTHLPRVGEPAAALTLLSMLCGAIAAGLATMVVGILRGGAEPIMSTAAGALIGGLACATTTNFWTQAVVPEARTLALMLILGVTLTLLHSLQRNSRRALLVAWALWGVALAVHLMSLSLAPALVLATWFVARHDAQHTQASRWSTAVLWLSGLVALLPGLSLYAYLPLRAMAHPDLNWGDPQTLSRFIWVVDGQQYRGMMGLSPAAALPRIADRLAYLSGALGVGVLLAGSLGFALLCLRYRTAGLVLGSVCLASFLQSVMYSANAAPMYMLPGEAILCATAGYLVAAIWPMQAARARQCAVGLGVVLLVSIGVVRAITLTQSLMEQARYAPARTFARDALAGLPPRAVIMARGDEDTFALWYGQYALHLRPDVAVVNTSLLAWEWYRDNLARQFPWLRWGGPWRSAVDSSAEDRVAIRESMLARATVGLSPIYWTDPIDMPTDICGLEVRGALFRCVPLK
jgi:hypothetical protein